MDRRTLILLLASSAAVFLFQVGGPAAGAGAGASACVAAASDPDGDGVCGECASPQSESDPRHAAFSPAVLVGEPAAARPVPDGSSGHGRGPTLASLSDSLILSRPPPASG